MFRFLQSAKRHNDRMLRELHAHLIMTLLASCWLQTGNIKVSRNQGRVQYIQRFKRPRHNCLVTILSDGEPVPVRPRIVSEHENTWQQTHSRTFCLQSLGTLTFPFLIAVITRCDNLLQRRFAIPEFGDTDFCLDRLQGYRRIRSGVCGSYQLVRSFRDGVPRSLSGRKSISFMMLASLTGSSCRRNTNEVFSHALAEPAVIWGTERGGKLLSKHPTFTPNLSRTICGHCMCIVFFCWGCRNMRGSNVKDKPREFCVSCDSQCSTRLCPLWRIQSVRGQSEPHNHAQHRTQCKDQETRLHVLQLQPC